MVCISHQLRRRNNFSVVILGNLSKSLHSIATGTSRFLVGFAYPQASHTKDNRREAGSERIQKNCYSLEISSLKFNLERFALSSAKFLFW